MITYSQKHSDLFRAVADIIATIATERDPNVLWPYHYSDNDAEVMHAAANRIYELTEWKHGPA